MNAPETTRPAWPSRRDLQLWLGACGLLLLAFTTRLAPGWASVDDVQLQAGYEPKVLRAHFLAQGRFGMALLHQALSQLGADPVHAPTLHAWLAIALFAAGAVLLARAWDLQDDPPAALLACALPLAHPYFAETWSFRIAPLYCALAQLLAFGALALLRRGRGWLVAPGLLVTASLTIYQVGLSPLLVAVFLGALLDLVRAGGDRAALRAAARVWLVILAVIAGAVLLYLALNALVLALAGVAAEARNGLLPPSGWPERALELLRVARQMVWRERALSAPWLVWLQLALLAATAALGLRHAARARAWPAAALGLAALAGAFAAVVAVTGAARVFYPAPRALTGLGFFWGGLFAALLLLAGPWGRRLALGGAALVALGWLGIDHRAHGEQVRRNARDLAVASRLAGRLEALPGWRGVQRVALVGAPPADWDLRTVAGNLNNSALGTEWSTAGLMQEVTGRTLSLPTHDELQAARARCAGLPKWPDPGSAVIDGPVAIACF